MPIDDADQPELPTERDLSDDLFGAARSDSERDANGFDAVGVDFGDSVPELAGSASDSRSDPRSAFESDGSPQYDLDFEDESLDASGGGEAAAVATKSRTAATTKAAAKTAAKTAAKKNKGPKDRRPARDRSGRGNFVVRFLREVLAELRKVLWPTRRELTTYTIIVIIFVVVMVSIVAGLDFGFARLVLAVFG